MTKRLKSRETPRQRGKYEEKEAYAENESDSSSDNTPAAAANKSRKKDERLSRKKSQRQNLISVKSRRKSSQDEVLSNQRRNATSILSKEDKDILALERKLGIKGNNNLKIDEEDGLEDLLTGLGASSDGEGSSQSNAPEELTSLKRKRHKVDRNVASKRTKTIDESNESDESEFQSIDGPSVDEAESNYDSNDEAVKKDEYEVLRSRKSDNKSRTRENPYIAPSVPMVDDTIADVKYKPSSLPANPEPSINMRRQLQGLLNRLTEANLLTVFREAEKKYWDNPRQSVTSMLSELILDSMADEVALNETFLVLQAAFATSMYRAVGTDFGAYLIDCVVKRIDKQYNKSERSGKGKECLNLITFLANLFIFNFIGSNLILDYINIFLRSVTELNTELLLRTVKSELTYTNPILSCLSYMTYLLYHKLMHQQHVELNSVKMIPWHSKTLS